MQCKCELCLRHLTILLGSSPSKSQAPASLLPPWGHSGGPPGHSPACLSPRKDLQGSCPRGLPLMHCKGSMNTSAFQSSVFVSGRENKRRRGEDRDADTGRQGQTDWGKRSPRVGGTEMLNLGPSKVFVSPSTC